MLTEEISDRKTRSSISGKNRGKHLALGFSYVMNILLNQT